MDGLKSKEMQLKYKCNAITSFARELIEEINKLENVPDDESAYHIMYLIGAIADMKRGVQRISADKNGNDLLDGYEAVANAIRAAK